MKTELDVKANMLTWAISRAGYELNAFIEKFPNVQKWLKGEGKPTVKQLEEFSKKVHIPFGYLFLTEPPIEQLPIPFFRTIKNTNSRVSINVYDTILLIQQRQDWLKDYLREEEFDPLAFVGRFKGRNNVEEIVEDIRKVLNLPENWASNFNTWQEAQDHLIQNVEDKRIITVFNGVVENNTSRPINVSECRGFVLVDNMAPFMFINNADSKAAQMFTIIHELAHIWTGQSAGFDFKQLQASDDPIEQLCDKVAAEFLVPKHTFNLVWSDNPNIKNASRYFKVSEIVIARRALDTNKITKKAFFEFYEEFINREFIKKENQSGGGNFYATTRKRLGLSYASHINHAVQSGKLLYRDAYKLTSLKGDTFQKFFSKYI